MIKPLFGNIRNVLIEKLSEASFDVYIAVAWITDKKYEKIILDLLERGISVTIISVDDEINQSGSIDWEKLVDKGAKVYWDNHHHKFCVIDRRIVLSGSFNWTNMASNRMNRENLLIIEEEKELINQFSKEFMKLKSSAIPLVKTPQTIIKEVIIEKNKSTGSLSRYDAYRTTKDGLVCGRCGLKLDAVREDDKIPPKMQFSAEWHCKFCGAYFSRDHKFL